MRRVYLCLLMVSGLVASAAAQDCLALPAPEGTLRSACPSATGSQPEPTDGDADPTSDSAPIATDRPSFSAYRGLSSYGLDWGFTAGLSGRF